MLTMPSFKKSLIVEQFQRNYLKLNVSSNAAVKPTFDICWAMSSNIATDVSTLAANGTNLADSVEFRPLVR